MSEPLARFVTDWAIRGVADGALEPSCGEAAFLLAAVERLSALDVGSIGSARLHVDGVELHSASAESAERLLREAGADAAIKVGDFFDVAPTGTFDAVVGNPPLRFGTRPKQLDQLASPTLVTHGWPPVLAPDGARRPCLRCGHDGR